MRRPDVLVVGGGPAGLSAANAAVRLGAAVLLIEENRVLGGQYHQRPAPEFPPGQTRLSIHSDEVEEQLRQARQLGVEIMSDTFVWGVFESRRLGCTRVTDGSSWVVEPKAVVLATGAFERVVPFPGWTSPRVITGGGAQNLLKHQGVRPGQKVVVAGTGPFLLVVSDQLVRAGAEVVMIDAAGRIDTLRFGLKLWRYPKRLREAVRYFGRLLARRVPIIYGSAVTGIVRTPTGIEVEVSGIDSDWKPVGDRRRIAADALATGFGFVPSSELARLYGCEVRFDPAIGAYVPIHDELMETTVPGVLVAGEAAGIGGFYTAGIEGEIAGIAAARSAGFIDRDAAMRGTVALRARRAHLRRFAELMNRTYRVRPGIYDMVTDGTIVCRCEEVAAGTIRDAVDLGDIDVNAVKARTRAGMGSCQGRMCEQNLRALVARFAARAPEEVGRFSPRPPIKPVPLAAIATIPPEDLEAKS